MRSGQRLHTLLGHTYAIYHIAFRADGRTLAVVGVDQTICLWDVQSGQQLDTIPVYRNELQALAFCATDSPGAYLLASGGDDCLIRLWAVAAALAGEDSYRQTLRPDGPYAGMEITGVSAAQKTALLALGAIEQKS